MSFHVGQKVVCVRDDWMTGHGPGTIPPENLPKRGRVYTIRDVVEGFWLSQINLRLNEVANAPLKFHSYARGLEPAFRADYFRPAVEGKTSISIFTEILKRETDDVPVQLPCDVESK